MKKSAKKKSYNLKDILDSDDELPTEYVDLPFVPAYQIDNRFEHIEEKKVNQELLDKQTKEFSNCKTVVALGYLNKKDTFCFQCLESTTGKKALQWFFNFLVIKDLHSRYTFLTTCLVPRYDNDYSSANSTFLKDCNEKIHRYKTVANK